MRITAHQDSTSAGLGLRPESVGDAPASRLELAIIMTLPFSEHDFPILLVAYIS